jgi:hypothetical protein
VICWLLRRLPNDWLRVLLADVAREAESRWPSSAMRSPTLYTLAHFNFRRRKSA